MSKGDLNSVAQVVVSSPPPNPSLGGLQKNKKKWREETASLEVAY
jgi:hypothetical protein